MTNPLSSHSPSSDTDTDTDPRIGTGSWYNERMLNVADQAIGHLMHIIFDSMLADGILPGELTYDKEFVKRLTPAQFDMLMNKGQPETQERIMQLDRQLDSS